MPVATSAALAGVAASQAAIAAAAAQRAHVERCKASMPNFDAKTATVAEMRDYSGCVNELYPAEIGPGATIAFKVLFVVALGGAAFSIWKNRQEYNDLTDSVLSGLIGFFVAPMALIGVVALLCGVRRLFT